VYIDKFVFLNTVPLNFISLESDFGHREETFEDQVDISVDLLLTKEKKNSSTRKKISMKKI